MLQGTGYFKIECYYSFFFVYGFVILLPNNVSGHAEYLASYALYPKCGLDKTNH